MAAASVSDDVRLGEVMVKDSEDGDVVLLGFPHDEGVRRNGGRVGAAEGPATLRRLMKKIGTIVNPEFNIDVGSAISVSDAGDIAKDISLEEAHETLKQRVQSIVSKNRIPFVIGGGNDESYPNAMGLLRGLASSSNDSPVGVVNIDAHLDVRPLKEGKVHSGSPFRLMLQDSLFQHNPDNKFVEFAVQGNQCSAIHAKFIEENKQCGKIVWLSELRRDGVLTAFRHLLNTTFAGRKIFVSFDLDSVQSSDAPGVSCPGTIGLSSQEALDICFEAGRNPNVVLFDLSEFNPMIEDYRTGRLVANMFYFFCMGVAVRKAALS